MDNIKIPFSTRGDVILTNYQLLITKSPLSIPLAVNVMYNFFKLINDIQYTDFELRNIMNYCSPCIKEKDDCCDSIFADNWKIILLPWEIKEISAYIGKKPSEFIDASPLIEDQLDYYTSQHVEDPLWARLFSVWKHPAGFKHSCPFLSKTGCLLPYTKKPFLCRIFPLEFNLTQNRIFLPEDNNLCNIAEDMGSINKILAYFGDNMDSLKQRFSMFRENALALLDDGKVF